MTESVLRDKLIKIMTECGRSPDETRHLADHMLSLSFMKSDEARLHFYETLISLPRQNVHPPAL